MKMNQDGVVGYVVKVGSLYVKDARKGIQSDLISAELTISEGEAAWFNHDNAVRTANGLHGTIMSVKFIEWHPNQEDK
ncbi:hypothetical protein [Secundilactobacillus similis]|uniref:hypothetical protein n=1 Tax=Secundilactobacillus similis TaxID=414682 RepID=UPI0006D27AC2|nr:hypothetical protein [Secundilactobacillus similis]